jgi:hypothetical protein
MNSNHRTKWIGVASVTLMLIALLVAGSLSAKAQSQDAQKAPPNLQELKDKLLQLEQTMRELKGQISEAEERQKSSNAQTKGTPEHLNNKPQKPSGADLNEVDTVLAPAGSTDVAVGKIPEEVAPKPAQTTNLERSMEIYGFVMLDMGYDFRTNNPDWFDVVRPTKLPSFNGEFAPDGKLFTGVRQTRFGTRASIPTSFGELKTIFEWELFGTGPDAGQTTFRLRHAYGEVGQIGAGQYWSPFMDIDVFPNIIEYWGPNGMVFFRNVQLRWMPIRGESRVTVALERPGASADQGIYADRIELVGVRPQFQWPDLSWEARLGAEWGYVEAAGIFRQLKWVDLNTDQFNLSGSDLGWGLNFSSNLKFSKKNIGRFQFAYGEGIENYMNDAPVDVGIQNNFQNPVTPIKGVALPVLGIVAFLDHNWNDRFSTAVGYSMLDIKNSDAQTPLAFHQGHYAITNLLWSPVENFMMGGEFQFGRRLNFSDGFNVNDYRIQFSFKYNFSRVFKF